MLACSISLILVLHYIVTISQIFYILHSYDRVLIQDANVTRYGYTDYYYSLTRLKNHLIGFGYVQQRFEKSFIFPVKITQNIHNNPFKGLFSIYIFPGKAKFDTGTHFSLNRTFELSSGNKTLTLVTDNSNKFKEWGKWGLKINKSEYTIFIHRKSYLNNFINHLINDLPEKHKTKYNWIKCGLEKTFVGETEFINQLLFFDGSYEFANDVELDFLIINQLLNNYSIISNREKNNMLRRYKLCKKEGTL